LNRYRWVISCGFFLVLGFLMGWLGAGIDISLRSSPQPKSRMDTESLRGLGYASGYEKHGGPTGVLRHEPAAWNGYNLFTSAHRAYAALTDMNGDTLHVWQHPFEEAFPDAHLPSRTLDVLDQLRYWRKVHPYPNGDLLAIHSPYGIVKIDRNSNLLWARHNVEHHDMDVGPDGTIYALTSEQIPYEIEGTEKKRLNDTISVYSDTGQKLHEYDLLEALKRSEYRGMMGFFGKHADEFLHTNSLDVLPNKDLLLSFRDVHSIARFDPETRRITWMLTGRTSSQHDAQYVGDGRITLFDNRRHLQASRALEIDLGSEKITWSYDGGDDNPFYSRCCGTVQRLPNGNTLINDSTSGHVFEVTPEGSIVWEWRNPHVDEAGNIATTFEFRRYEPGYFSFPLP